MIKYYIGTSPIYFGFTLFWGLFVVFSIFNFAKIKNKKWISPRWQNGRHIHSIFFVWNWIWYFHLDYSFLFSTWIIILQPHDILEFQGKGSFALKWIKAPFHYRTSWMQACPCIRGHYYNTNVYLLQWYCRKVRFLSLSIQNFYILVDKFQS